MACFVLAKVTAILTTVTLASTNNALPDDGVTAPKHVGALSAQFSLFINNMFVTLLSSTCFEH